MRLNCCLFLYAQKVSSTKMHEKLQLSANPTVVKIEKAEDKNEKAYSLGWRVASRV